MSVYAETVANHITDFGYMVGEDNVNNSRWNRAARLRFLNIAQVNIVIATRCMEQSWSSDIGSAWASANDERLTLPGNLFDDTMIKVYWLDSDSIYHPLTEFHPHFQSIQNDDTGTPNQFYRIGRKIYLKPLQDAAGTVVIIGQLAPDELVSDGDTSLIPGQFRHIITYGAVQMAFMEDDEFGKADRVERLYLRGIKEIKKYTLGLRSQRTPKFEFSF